jgi:hypothetical protein
MTAKGKPKMSIVCAAMRRMLHLCYGVLKTGLPFDPDYRPNSVKSAQQLKTA